MRDLPRVPAAVTSVCDNKSVGVIITDDAGSLLMFERATPPIGIAPVAGHVDDHGTAEDAAVVEVAEEVGLEVVTLTLLFTEWRPNFCRRQYGRRGAGHDWTVYRAQVTGELTPSDRETRNVAVYTPADVYALAVRTGLYMDGQISDDEFAAAPGLEPVWVRHLVLAGVIAAVPYSLDEMEDRLVTRSPYSPQPYHAASRGRGGGHVMNTATTELWQTRG